MSVLSGHASEAKKHRPGVSCQLSVGRSYGVMEWRSYGEKGVEIGEWRVESGGWSLNEYLSPAAETHNRINDYSSLNHSFFRFGIYLKFIVWILVLFLPVVGLVRTCE